jgi:hypothetical protein
MEAAGWHRAFDTNAGLHSQAVVLEWERITGLGGPGLRGFHMTVSALQPWTLTKIICKPTNPAWEIFLTVEPVGRWC